MIRVDNLTKRYDTTLALDRLSLTIPQNTIFGLVGPNGSGKSTLLKLLMGFLFPDGGTIDLGPWSRTGIGYTSDRPFLPVRFRAAEFLTLVGELSGLRGAALSVAVMQRLEQVGLSDAARTRISALSKGMFQRLSLAAALVHDPPLLLLDEPMGGLDPGQQAALRAVIQSARQEGKTILLSTHRLSEVTNLCTHIAILKQGQLVRTGALADVLAPQPQVMITVDHLPAELGKVLCAQYPGVTVAGSTITLDDAAQACKNDILHLLMEHGCDIQQLIQQRATLEQVYLEAVRP
ncbi:MAG: ABC transporter ATP-binding protein [Anaerolineae bacterium]